MPTYDFLCADCGNVFEGFVWRDERPCCPACDGERTGRQFSPPGVTPQTEPGSEERATESVEEAPSDAPAPAAQLLEPTVSRIDQTLRRQDPRVWDLERAFEGRQSAQLIEIAEKSQRLIKMMDRIEALEPLMDEIAVRDRELQRLEQKVDTLEKSGRAVAAELEERTGQLDRVSAEAADLRQKVRDGDEALQQSKAENEALQEQSNQEQTRLAGQIVERDKLLDLARNCQASLEAELQVRDHRVEDATLERDNVKAELKSRTTALFKRDEMIQEADREIARLREEIRDRDRSVTDANQLQEGLRAELGARDLEIQRQITIAQDFEVRAVRLDGDLSSVRTELAQAQEALAASQSKNKELTEAWASAISEVELQRAKLQTSTDHLLLTQTMLDELKPMLESLETTLTPEPEEPVAALPSHETTVIEPSND